MSSKVFGNKTTENKYELYDTIWLYDIWDLQYFSHHQIIQLLRSVLNVTVW